MRNWTWRKLNHSINSPSALLSQNADMILELPNSWLYNASAVWMTQVIIFATVYLIGVSPLERPSYVYPLSEFQIWPFCILRRPCPCRYLSIFTLFVSISSRLYVAVSRSCCLMVFFPNRASLDSWPNRGLVALTPPCTLYLMLSQVKRAFWALFWIKWPELRSTYLACLSTWHYNSCWMPFLFYFRFSIWKCIE